MTGKFRQSNSVTVLLCLCLCLCFFSSCSWEGLLNRREEETALIKSDDHISLGLYREDSAVPYFAKTRLNRETLTLCYNGLVRLDSSWTAHGELASSWRTAGRTVTVTIRDDAVFADGTPVTAQDCVYSYELAMLGSSAYQSYFQYITSFEAVGERTFSVSFKNESVYAVNFLDIPIVKSGTGHDVLAVGAGYYYLKIAPSETAGKDMYKMYRNTRCVSAPQDLPEILDVVLLESTEELLYAFNYGGIDVLSGDLSSGGIRYRTNAETVTYINNTLTYAVVNTGKEILSYGKRNYIADALTKMISRTAVTQNILNGCGVATWVPFNPAWSKVTEAQFVPDAYSESGYIDSFYRGRWYRNPQSGYLEWYGDEISLTVIAKADNIFEAQTAEYLTTQLNAFGIRVTTALLSDEEYDKARKAGNYDIRIETASLSRDMNLLDLFDKAKVTVSDTLKQAVHSFNRGTSTIYDLNAAFQNEMPLIPLYYTACSLSVNTRVTGTFSPAPGNLFDGIATWKIEEN